MPNTRPHACETSASHPDDEYEYYFFEDLLRKGIVTSRADLYRKIKYEGFPRPEKPPGAAMQVRAPYRKNKVHAYCDRRAALCEQTAIADPHKEQHATTEQD